MTYDLHQCPYCYNLVNSEHEEFCRLNPDRNRTFEADESETKLIDHIELGKSQEADIREDCSVWIHDNGTAQDIKLDANAATLLFDFLLLHQDRLIRHRDAAAKVKAYNAEMDIRNRAIVESREKPWLPLYDGE